MKAQHTPEPWVKDWLRIIRNPGIGGLFNIASCADPTANQVDGKAETREANAARIVACVNACVNLADPAADIAALREALRAMLQCNHELGAISRPVADQARAALVRTERGDK